VVTNKSEYRKKYRLEHIDKEKQQRKAYYNSHKEKEKINSIKSRLKRYGITVERYNEMFNNQEGRCAICKRHQSEFKQALYVDHNHKTGKVRALLCPTCNSILGKFMEDIQLFKSAIKYMEIFNEQ
jgi:tRNA U34 5-carboxymethylaminomethyl modifying GTPase MnmE/TrmE